MALHNELGRKGEQLGEEGTALSPSPMGLSGLGYNILYRNWRHFRYEIDVVATKEQVLHFIEVKTRQTTTFGLPEEDISRKKMHRLIQATRLISTQYPGKWNGPMAVPSLVQDWNRAERRLSKKLSISAAMVMANGSNCYRYTSSMR